MLTNVCFFCSSPTKSSCEGCEISFCCPTHGKLHRRDGVCFPWTVEERDIVGRVMVTTRNIVAGETIFLEEPIVHGPNQEGSPICLSCYSQISDESYKCPKCQYPLCGSECSRSPQHFAECQVLSRGPPPIFDKTDGRSDCYHCLLPLRLLLLTREHPEVAGLAGRLMDHEDDRKGGSDWKITEETVVNRLINECKGGEYEGFTVDEVRKAVGILEVNSYEVHSFVNCGFRGCFPAASLLSHSCVANSRHVWSINPPFTNMCIATVDIPAGSEVLTSYHHPTISSILRRTRLRTGWYFDCSCFRCSSKSELGTNLNTLVCPACGVANVMPDNPLQSDSKWVCGTCGHHASHTMVVRLVECLLSHVETLARTKRYQIDEWIQFEEAALQLVHPKHQVVMEVAKFLVPILGRSPDKTSSDFPREILTKKLNLANRQLDVLNIVEPGYSKSRVKVIYEVIETDVFLAVTSDPALDIQKLTIILTNSAIQLTEVVRVLERLGADNGYETVLLGAAINLIKICKIISKEIKEDMFDIDFWKSGPWSLIELWRYQ